jgi:protein MpaA
VLGINRADDVVLIMATIHGSEPAGTPLVRRLTDHLAKHPRLLAGRKVVLLPLANPDGMARGTRTNARRVDLNRNFPSANWSKRAKNGSQPLSEPESRAVFELIETHRPRRIVSIHQPLGLIDYDGDAKPLADAMAARSDLPVKRLGSKPGSLGSYAGVTKGIPIITLELPRAAGGMDSETLWKRYGPMLLAAIRYPEPTPK